MASVKKLMYFYKNLFCHPVTIIFTLTFIIAKVWGNTSYGGTIFNGLRSGVIGVLAYSLGFGAIHLLSKEPQGYRFKAACLDYKKARLGSFIILLVYIFIFGSIVDQLQRSGNIGGQPIYSYIPWWNAFLQMLGKISLPFAIPGMKDFMLTNILRGFFLFILIPLIVLLIMGLRPGDFGIIGGDIKPALPFLFIYLAAFIFGGLTIDRLVFLLYALLYAGIQEEFFYRGVMQPIFTSSFRSPVWGMVLSVLLFSLLHIPDFSFRVYPTIAIALSSTASVALFGGLMAYGAYCTGMLWPWMLIHALSNISGW